LTPEPTSNNRKGGWSGNLARKILFGFIYPARRKRIPDTIIEELVQRLSTLRKKAPSGNHDFKGTLLSREQYLIDLELWGYPDARLKPNGFMSHREVALWTKAIGNGY
jgi:hypothetical protein